jgi:hypothetical protein
VAGMEMVDVASGVRDEGFCERGVGWVICEEAF